MIARWLTLFALLALALPNAQALADGPAAEPFHQFKSGETIVLRPDRAYVLLRLDTDLFKYTAHLMRIPASGEIEAFERQRSLAYDEAKAKAKDPAKLPRIEDFRFAYSGEPNFFALAPQRSLLTVNKLAAVLAEVTPGDYVVYGNGIAGNLYTCFCLGTVQFAANAGEVTDLGTMLFAKAWEPSALPEFAGEVDLGRSAVMDFGLIATALRPARDSEPTPLGFAGYKLVPARFQAVGPFVETNTVAVNRLAPIPGVLAYDGGKVVDVRNGQVVPQN